MCTVSQAELLLAQCSRGEDNHMHGADEFITEENLLRNAKIIAHAVLALCGE